MFNNKDKGTIPIQVDSCLISEVSHAWKAMLLVKTLTIHEIRVIFIFKHDRLCWVHLEVEVLTLPQISQTSSNQLETSTTMKKVRVKVWSKKKLRRRFKCRLTQPQRLIKTWSSKYHLNLLIKTIHKLGDRRQLRRGSKKWILVITRELQ